MVQQWRKKSFKRTVLEKPWSVVAALVGLLLGAFLITRFIRGENLFFCPKVSITGSKEQQLAESNSATPTQLEAIVHYATSSIVPQQSLEEISVSFQILKDKSPCNFLVFGLGHDSLMWASLNPRGTTLFLEEDPSWITTVIGASPSLRASHVAYRTQLADADRLLASYKSNPHCLPSGAYPLRDNDKCRLALTSLPDEFYETEWDVIMIDAPKGYYAEAPGRMAAIFSAAVMARNRRGSGPTHVFLHDVDRKVEKTYAEEFLCKKYLVGSAGRLWHFEIPNPDDVTAGITGGDSFC